MALPVSGQLSMNNIRVELGVPAQAPFNIDDARAGVYVALNPYSPTIPPVSGQVSISDWYSYCQLCTTTTTTTAIPITYDLYIADQYNCSGCTISSTMTVALPTGTIPSIGSYYAPLIADGYVYKLTSTTLIGPGLILINSYTATCLTACTLFPLL